MQTYFHSKPAVMVGAGRVFQAPKVHELGKDHHHIGVGSSVAPNFCSPIEFDPRWADTTAETSGTVHGKYPFAFTDLRPLPLAAQTKQP